jgi:hypothetical protein
MSLPVSIDTRVTFESSAPKRVQLRSKAKFNGYFVNFTVREDAAAGDDLGTGTLSAGVAAVKAPTDQMNNLLAYDVGDSVLVSFQYTGSLWMDNVQFG